MKTLINLFLVTLILTYSNISKAGFAIFSTVDSSVGTVLSPKPSRDIWRVTCPANSISYLSYLYDMAPVKNPLLMLHSVSGSLSSAVSFDSKDNDNSTYAQSTSTIYKNIVDLYITKSKATGSAINYGVENYSLSVTCRVKIPGGSYLTRPLSMKVISNQ